MTTIVASVIIAVVIVASVFGIIWSRRRTRFYRDQMRRSRDRQN